MTDSTIKVSVANYGRKYLYMRYKDPTTGKSIAKSSGKTTMKEAVKEAGKWEAELREGRYKPLSRVTWTEFRQPDDATRGHQHDHEILRRPERPKGRGRHLFGVFRALGQKLQHFVQH